MRDYLLPVDISVSKSSSKKNRNKDGCEMCEKRRKHIKSRDNKSQCNSEIFKINNRIYNDCDRQTKIDNFIMFYPHRGPGRTFLSKREVSIQTGAEQFVPKKLRGLKWFTQCPRNPIKMNRNPWFRWMGNKVEPKQPEDKIKIQSQYTRTMHLLNQKAYVNGNWVTAVSNKTFQIRNPVDDSIVGVAPDMRKEDAVLAIKSAFEAFDSWQDTTAKERSHILRKWYNLLVEHSEDIARIMTLESGKPLNESRGEITYGNSFVEWFSEEARRIHGEIIESPVKTKQIYLQKQPIGVAALITPWNFPHAMITRKASAALAAGCTCVVRPAEDTPLTALALAELAHQAGFPKGVFNVITSDRGGAQEIGQLFCESPLVAGISFTGSTQVGKTLYRQCAGGVKRLALELGGNAPFIVFESADINKAVQGAIVSKFRNCGQACVASSRFLIHETVFDEFVSKFKNEIDKLVLGNGQDEKVTVGPLINKNQIDKVDGIVQDAIAKGAKVVTGAKPNESLGKLFYEPTILTNIKENMRCYSEEVFGPVACCNSFKTEREAIQIANCLPQGLAAYFYSKDISQIFRVSRHIEAGMIGVNEGLISTTEAAFGGVKESGLGREGSHHGIDDFVYIKYICLGDLQNVKL